MATSNKKKAEEHPAVRFFKKEKEEMVCQVKIDAGAVAALAAAENSAADIAAASLCGAVIKVGKEGTLGHGTRIGNLTRHLKRKHPDEHKMVEKEIEEKEAKKTKSQERK